MTKHVSPASSRSSASVFALSPIDRREDQVQLLRFLPLNSRLDLQFRSSGCSHSQPVFGFTRLPLADADAVHKFFPRACIVRFAIIRTDAGRCPDQLPD